MTDDPNYLEIIKYEDGGWITYRPWGSPSAELSCTEVCQRCGGVIASMYVDKHNERCRPD